MKSPMERIDALIAHLENAPVCELWFTQEGKREICKPEYLLVEDRDLIISLLEKSATASDRTS